MNKNILINLEEQKNKLNLIKESLDKAKEMRIKYETRLEELKKEQQKLIEEIKEYGYDPDELEEVLEEKANQYEKLMDKIERLMPDENGNIPEIDEMEHKYTYSDVEDNDQDVLDFINDVLSDLSI